MENKARQLQKGTSLVSNTILHFLSWGIQLQNPQLPFNHFQPSVSGQAVRNQTALDNPTKHNSEKATPLSTPGKDGNWVRKEFLDTQHQAARGCQSPRRIPQLDTQADASPRLMPAPAHRAPAQPLPLIISSTNISASRSSRAPAAASRKEEAPAFHSPSAPEWVELAKFHAEMRWVNWVCWKVWGFAIPPFLPSLRLFLPPSPD